jgi:hypothetical protein
MIFRLDGSVEEVLALTPIIREWKSISGDKVIVDVPYPELLAGNPSVHAIMDDVCEKDAVTDFNLVDWQKTTRAVCESYAEHLLGSIRPMNWRSEMYHSEREYREAGELLPKRNNIAIVSLSGSSGNPVTKWLTDSLEKVGYTVVWAKSGSFGLFRAIVSKAVLYVGEDGPDTAIALTTDVPAVVCYTWRSPAYFAPFRRGIPFETVLPDNCCYADSCLSANGWYEMGKTYGVKCVIKDRFACKKPKSLDRIMDAVEKIRRSI